MSAVPILLEWIYSQLSTDSPLQGYAPGGIWRSEIPSGAGEAPTPTPYIVYTYDPSQSKDETAFRAKRAYSELCVEVVIVGTVNDWTNIVSGNDRIDALLTVNSIVTLSEAIISGGFRITPLESDPLIAGNINTNLGGLYKFFVTETS